MKRFIIVFAVLAASLSQANILEELDNAPATKLDLVEYHIASSLKEYCDKWNEMEFMEQLADQTAMGILLGVPTAGSEFAAGAFIYITVERTGRDGRIDGFSVLWQVNGAQNRSIKPEGLRFMAKRIKYIVKNALGDVSLGLDCDDKQELEEFLLGNITIHFAVTADDWYTTLFVDKDEKVGDIEFN